MFVSSQRTEYNAEMIDPGIKTLFDRKKQMHIYKI